MIVEEELVIHVGLCPDVVGKEVRPLCIECIEHIEKGTFCTIIARCTLAIVPQHHVGEQVVGHLGKSAHVQGTLMLVTYLVTRSPVRTGIGRQGLYHTSHCIEVVSAVVP